MELVTKYKTLVLYLVLDFFDLCLGQKIKITQNYADVLYVTGSGTGIAGSGTGSTGTGTGTNAGCTAVPNVIATPNTYNIGQLMTTGPWYGYLTFNSDSGSTQNPTDVNVVNYYTSLGKSVEPTRSQLSEIIYQEKRKYASGSCAYSLEISEFTTDGRQFGPYNGLTSTGTISDDGYDASIIWSTDQSTYILFFWCAKHNWASGACASTHIYVYTRTRPTDMSSTLTQSINSAVNGVLQTYCLNTSQFAAYKWDNTLPECPKPAWPDCFNHTVNAYKTLIE
ncbi:uncharacterized protein LOC129583419 isoform X2 [Paramacrobiotus metropolitanus]|uniref:uncharacterized protein LOC129583419 isoform X2 n=1 Tax=Paramacrobiotus metropolitanus TaxID=2943436 RepID=UPI00244589E8|nr:uncharacterized protein LOC129583419 isoform X2 [Paramacrobiotus metropolitanus]XP_055331184.1 uncharacterized protein LOC129583419 isoform X2 [Paramacrobiotus metropolitanus]